MISRSQLANYQQVLPAFYSGTCMPKAYLLRITAFFATVNAFSSKADSRIIICYFKYTVTLYRLCIYIFHACHISCFRLMERHTQ